MRCPSVFVYPLLLGSLSISVYLEDMTDFFECKLQVFSSYSSNSHIIQLDFDARITFQLTFSVCE